MQLECPHCGTKVYSFDAEAARGCPKCGHPFAVEEPVDRGPLVPTWVLWSFLLVGPGSLGLLGALIASGNSHQSAMVGDVGFPGLLLFVFVLCGLIAMRRETPGSQIGTFILAVIAAVIVNGCLFFAGCMLALSQAKF